jgi:hypothetical protein
MRAERAHRQNYRAIRRTTHCRPARLASSSATFSGAPHLTHSDERNRIQVIQNKQSVSLSLDTLVKARCGNFCVRISGSALRGSTESGSREADPSSLRSLGTTTRQRDNPGVLPHRPIPRAHIEIKTLLLGPRDKARGRAPRRAMCSKSSRA